MKKFAKILGFLGFFVTLATAQIGSAYALRVECNPGYYIRRGETWCTQCPSAEQYGEGVFCQGSPEGYPYEIPDTGAESDIGIELCRYGKCNDGNNLWLLTPAGASSPSECKGTCKTSCIHPNSNCPLPNTNLCEYDRTEQVDGEIECFGSCTPENTPTNYCDVTCPKTCEARCICPLDESQTGSCPGYDTTEMVTGVLACGASTGSCDVKHNIYGNPTANNGYCQQTGSCTVKCEEGTCPTGTTCDWDLDSHPQSGHVSGDDCVDDLGNVISPQQCDMINVVCSDPCQYWDGKECKTYSSTTTYKCGSNTVPGPIDAICGVPYTINRTTDGGSTQIIDTSSCTPSGYRLQGWRLTIDYSPYDQQLFSDPEVPAYNRFNWQATTNNPATFVAEWEEDKLYIHYHRYGGNWVQSNPPADDKEAFTISELPLTKTWTLTRNNSTFLGWCDDLYYNHLSDATWLNSHCQGPSSYTIPNTVNSDVHLYAWWGCAAGYTLNNSYQCVANAIDVIYICTSPDSGYSTINKSFSGDATVGATYTIRSVGSNESNQQVDCSFPGYYLENNYQWKRVGSNPEELYSPGPMNSPWAYTTTQTFELSGDYWKPNTYRVLYKCGSIDGNPVSGGDTADSAIYGQPYYVATNIYDSFINICSEPNGYVVDHWTFEQNNTSRYVTGEQFNNPDGWNLPEDDHYFVAHWIQTGGALTLDPNGGLDSNPAILYTTFGNGVYLDSGRTQQMSTNSNGLTTNPSKSANVRLYPNGTGAYFQWDGSTVTYPANVNDNLSLDFTGFYNDDDTGDVKLCIGTDKFITSDGISIGSGYNVSESHTWYAHWDPRQIYLPIAERSGYDFLGWYDASENGNLISNGNEYYEVSGDIVLYAHWGVACRSVSFNENGGTSTGVGNNNRFWKISGETGWYGDSACTSGITPNVGSSRPTKENATFIGYDDTDSTPTVRIFNDLGAITTAGENWTITQNATLYAQYECVAPYHLGPNGTCVVCAAGEFWSEQDNACLNCTDYIGRYGSAGAGNYTWTSRAPYNWSVKQCYRVCGSGEGVQETCDVVPLVTNHNEMEQFLTGSLISGDTGRQISFYGNEFATSGAFNTCNATTGVTNCPQGLLANPSAAHKLMAAAVDFYEKRDLNGTYEPNGKRYIVGGRSIEEGIYKLNNGFAWSQVVGEAQLSEVEPIISIIYPATSAPAAANPEHYTFSNYVYPANNPEITPVDSTLALTTSNAAGIISYAINLDPANNNMSPIINQNRNLYAQYTADPTYTLTYSCGDGDTGNPPSPQSSIYTGDTVNISTPSSCSHYSTNSLTGWAVTATESGQNLGTVAASIPSFSWEYTQNVTFTAQWGNANTQQIIYNKIPTTTGNTTPDGNTLVLPDAGTMPTQFECGDGQTSTISGAPQLQNSNGETIGVVVAWCDDNGVLSNCVLPKTVQHTPCADKNVFAKWECTDPRYHLNENEDDCVLCPGGDYWDPNANGGNGACVPCSQLGGGWTSIAGYNWGPDQCYRFCPSGKTCAIFNESTYGDFNIANVVQQYNTTQIEFYGNHYTHSEIPDVCASDSDVKYCPKLLSGSTAGALKPMWSPVTFMKKGNATAAGTRHIIGNRDGSHLSSPYYLTNSSGKIWSHIMGPGQYTTDNYTFIIYPTDTAPAPSDNANDPLFKGYYDAQTGGTQRVAAALGLTTTNATDIMGGMTPANQIINRTLYPQYCATGEIWNGSDCITDPNTEFTVTYDCGEGQPGGDYTDTATVVLNGTYTVLANGAVPNGQGGFVTCNLSGQGFNGWKFSGDGQTYTGGTGSQVTPWTYDNETMTATYRPCTANEVLVDGVCYSTCSVSCVIPSGLQSNGCPVHDPVYPNPNNPNDPDGVRCEYVSQTIGGYDNGDGNCRYISSEDDHEQGEIIPQLGDCRYNVTCNNTSLEWNSDPNVWACVWPSGTVWTVTFKCDVNDSVTTYNVTVPGTIPSVPAASTCAQTGSSFTNWKDADHGGDLLEAGATNVSWTHEYNATYTPDRTQNIYHAHLNPYSYGQSNQSGTFGDAGVENLWERYGDNWYKNYNNGNLAGPMSFLNAEQLPTRTGGYSFAGYKTMDGYPRLNYADGRWNLMPPTTITDDEEWYAQWTQCTAGQYYLNGCQNCPPSHPNSDPTTATSMSDCYYSCSRCEANGCPAFGGAVCAYADPNSLNLNNGGVYYGTNTCVLLPGNTMPNCPYTVTSCAQGYQVNSNKTACEPIQTVVNYSCGTNGSPASYGVQMFNTATYGENYTVAQNDQNQEIQCTPTTTGYVLLLDTTHGNKPVWNLNYGTGQSDYTGHTFTWQYIFPYGTNPTFTAQYVCDTDNGYHLINGTCQKCPENSYWTGSQCKECDQGYHVNDAGDGCTPNTINLNYSTQCGTSNPQSSTCTFNTGFNLATHNTNTGYTFNGWTTPGTNNGPHASGASIQCTATYLSSAVYTNNATITITGTCTSINDQCPATLPSNANASMVGSPTISNNQCTYKIKCNSCLGSGEQNYFDCYTYGDSADTGGVFTVIGNMNDGNALNNIICTPATYNAVYKCGTGTPTGPYTDNVTITYNGSYTVLPNGTENGGVVTCSKDGEMFNHWAFNLNSGTQYNGGEQISPWRYHGQTVPTFTAQYGPCPEGEVLVDGECKTMCIKNCTYPGANPGACPSDYPANAICTYDPSSNQVIGYRPSPYSNKCLDVDYPHDPVVSEQCDVTDVICPTHYQWNSATLKCDPVVYYVTLDANGGTTGAGFISKLFEQYNVGWGINETGSFVQPFQLASYQLPTSPDISQVFTGYGINCNSNTRMISADGLVIASPTTLIDNTQTWHACYGPNTSATFKVRFKCNVNEPDVIPVQEVHVGESIVAPATTLCPGVAFNQWKGTLIQPVIMLNASTSTTWNNYADEIFVPDVKAVYHVDLNENGGTFPSDDYQELWYAVDLGWYKNAGLTTQITSIPGSSLPTKQGSNFNGWLDSATQEQRGNFSGANWVLPTNGISTNETWDAQWGPCAAGQYYQNGQCNECPSGYTSDPLWAQSQTDCYKVCHTCVMPTCPTGEGIDHCEQNPNSTYNGFLFYSSITPNPNTCQQTLDNTMDNPIICDVNIVCETGYVPSDSGLSCVKKGFTIDLKSHRKTNLEGALTGVDVDPDLLYIWSGRGVYWYSDYTTQIKPDGTNPVIIPSTYAVVRFNPNGDGVTFTLDNYTYTNQPGDRNVSFTFSGFYNSEDGSSQYIRNNGVITNSGQNIAMTTDTDLIWHAKWNANNVGTLPEPTRPGYRFIGWFSEMTNGYQIDVNTPVYQSMNVYAHWERAKYYVNLDANGGQWGTDPVDKLWEQYGYGWSTDENGTFDSNLTLDQSQLPSYVNNSKIFDGYWTQRTGGIQQIRANGSVVDTSATTLTESGNTWYARYVDNNGTFKITFRCGDNEPPLGDYTQYVQNGGNVRVPPKAECPNPGRSFTRWNGEHGTTFTARGTEYMATWSDVYANEDFTPNWNDGDVYHVTLLQTGADTPGDVENLYEKYGAWWALYQNGQYPITALSGNQLPTRAGYDFAGFKTRIGGYTRGNFDSENGEWTPQSNTEITNDEEWVPKWTQCKPYWYYDSNLKVCVACPEPYTNNSAPESLADCYDGRCEERCVERSAECPSDPNALEFEYSDDVYEGTNYYHYYQNHCVLDIWAQQGSQQEVVPSCACTIKTCKPGYHLVNGVCFEYAWTDIRLDPNGGTWASNVPYGYKFLYTIEDTGVYRDNARTDEMTPDNGVALHAIPSNGASVTLDANGGTVTWGGGTGETRTGTAAFGFKGFYNSETPGYALPYILPEEINGETYAFITGAGQSTGMGYNTSPHTWYAQWNRSVTLPTPTRQNYTFVGWVYNGELVSNPWTVPVNATNITLAAQWTKNAGTIVTYNCNNEGGQGGTATDPTPAYIGETYTVLGNFIPCSKPATETTRAHEFENWQFNGGSYLPGYVFSPWSYTGSNPTFNAHYKECGDGYYFGSNGCQACPPEYDHSDIAATGENNCFRNCPIECNHVCPDEEGILDCVYTIVSYPVGTQYYGGDCQVNPGTTVESCDYRVICGTGYLPDANWKHCIKQNQHEITLDQNGGTGGQDKIYTIYNTGVYRDAGRTYSMTQYPLLNLPLKSVNVTFNSCDNNDPNCENATVWERPVDLEFKGYYQTASNNSQYIYATGLITSTGLAEGKSYTDNNQTWYAQWNSGTVDSDKWPLPPTRQNACATYSFYGWYTEINGGTPVSYNTPVSEDVTWYAHWCESCPTGTIDHGSCSDAGCVARFTCNDGYYWNADNCACTATTGLTLTYQPNGGTPDADYTENRYFGETFTTRGGNTYTKVGHIIAKWANVGAGGSFPLLAHSYTYNYNGNTTLEPEWKQCTCTFNGNSGVESCDANIVTNNTCTPDVECKPGYVNGHYTCTNEYLETCSAQCDICPAGTYQNGNQCSTCTGNTVSAAGATVCELCDPGYTANAEHTQCVGNPITIDWDENGGRLVDNGICQFCTEGCVDITCESCGAHPDNMLTLANVTHSNSAMRFLGWKLATGNDLYSAGTNVMCTHDNVGVYSGTTYQIQAQWDQCLCIDPLNPHVAGCTPIVTNDTCAYINWCDTGYELDRPTAYTPAAVCNPITSNITYNCGDGTGTPVTATDTAEYDADYTVKNEGGANCQKTGFNFAGWLLSANNRTYQPGYTFSPWNLPNSNVTFTAQYSQCAAGEVWVNGTCEPCTCSQNNWSSGVASCVANQASVSACSAVVTCETGYNNPQWSCNGATCSAQCDQIQSDAIYVCGAGATGTPPATETMNYGATHTVKTKANCGKSGHTFNGWHFTGTNWDYNPGATITWNYGTDQTFIGQWCENCGNVMNGSCSLDASVAGSCSYDCSCDPGYELVGGVCTAHPICNPSNYNVIYQPNGGMNNGVLGQQVVQNVTYGVEFTTKDGTIFTNPNNIVTAWDTVSGGAYPELNYWYLYNTTGDTILKAHWEQCTCTQDNGVASCTTSSTNTNTCSCTGECAPGYVYGGCNCDGTACTPICNKKKSDAIYECGDGATGTPPATETMEYGATHTVKPKENCSKTNHTFMTWLFSGDSNYHNPDDTIAWNYTENKTFTGQWCENCVQPSNGSCELGAGFAGSCQYTCSCEPGYKLVGDCNAHPVCEPDNTLAIHYKSNNGLNQTYNQPVTYGQSFVTEGGTRFTKTNHIMTHWNVESGPSNTFTNGAATLSGNYVYNDATDTTLSAQWAQCICNADGCTTYATNSNECACNASEESCPDGYIYGGCECNGTNCAPICTLGGSNANYVCGTGIGTGYSTYVNYGDTHTILSNTPVVGCYRDNSTFAGWLFEGDNVIYFDNVGATVPWNYTTDKTFTAKWCSNCPVVEHGTNLLTIPEPGVCRCDLTCNTGYHVANGVCEPNENGITYKPNGGTPNQNYTQTVKYDASFTTLDWSAEHYRKPRHIMTQWVVESGGAGTFDSGYANLGTEYTYKTDGATVLAADWTECAADKISLNNQCQQCNCTAGTGTTSCGTLSTDDDTCAWGPVSCLTGYVNPTLDCSDDTTNCTAYCTKCGNKQVEVNGACTDCECEINGDGVNSGCGFVSNNGNICNWNPTTCELGYGYPDLTCTETDHNNNCTASCTICEAGFYGDDGVECKPCPDGKTSLPGATSKKECFIDPNSCAQDEHIEHGECVSNTRACSIPNATSAARIWNPAIGTYGPCTVIECDAANGYHESGNACVRDTCTVAHGSAESERVGPTSWECFVTRCDPGYEPSSDAKSCVECANRYVDGDVAVSSYVSECEIAACMYQGQKYALQNGECVPICEDETDETGTKVWDDTAKKCVRTCKPGYKMW